MNDSYLQLRDIVSNVLDNGNTHDENTELNFLYLCLELLYRGSFDDFIDFFLSILLFGKLFFLLFSLFFSFCCTFIYLIRNFVIAVINYFN